MNKLNFALVGCGRIAKRYGQLLTEGAVSGARLHAVCDIVKAKADAFSSEYAVPGYTCMDEMMKKESNIDVVAVLTPSGMHAENVVHLSEYKKPIVVEKPMALRLDDADRMIHACDKNGSKLFVVKQNRYNVPVQKLMEALNEGRFGQLVLGTVRVRWSRDQRYYDQDSWRGTWAYDGGVFTNQASHHIDLLEWVMGDVESVMAKSATALVDIEAENVGVAILKFTNGALGVIEATTATRPVDLEGSISVLGEKGTVEIGGFAVNELKVWKFVDERKEDADVLAKYSVNPPDVYGFGHKAYLENVVESLNEHCSALVDGLTGRKSLELINAIYESIETGKEIPLRFRPKYCRLGERNHDR